MSKREITTTFNDRNYSGYLPSIRFKEYDNQIVDELSESDLIELDKNIQENYDGFSKAEDMVRFYKDKGSLNKNGDVVIKDFHHIKVKGEPSVDCDPIDYEMWQNRVGQWHDWWARKEFIESKKVEELEKTAEGLANKFKV